jgi:hypothetical protein
MSYVAVPRGNTSFIPVLYPEDKLVHLFIMVYKFVYEFTQHRQVISD